MELRRIKLRTRYRFFPVRVLRAEIFLQQSGMVVVIPITQYDRILFIIFVHLLGRMDYEWRAESVNVLALY